MAEYTNPLESFAKGYAAIGAVQEDMASKDILKQAYASATPDQAKDPQAQQNIYNQAAIMAGQRGQASLAYSFQKQAKELEGAAQTKQLNDLKIKEDEISYAGQLLSGATTEEDLKSVIGQTVKDPAARMVVESVMRNPNLDFEAKKKSLSDMTMTAKEKLQKQRDDLLILKQIDSINKFDINQERLTGNATKANALAQIKVLQDKQVPITSELFSAAGFSPEQIKLLGGGDVSNKTDTAEPGRKFNVGNLRPGSIKYENMSGVDKNGFATFATPEAGIKALEQDISVKLTKGFDTPQKFIEKYAPPKSKGGDNPDATTNSYINNVAKALGINPTDKIEDTPQNRQLLKDAIIKQEGVVSPSSTSGSITLPPKQSNAAAPKERAQNVLVSVGEAVNRFQTISSLPSNTTLGAFSGLTGKDSKGFTEGLKGIIGRNWTTEDQRSFEKITAGLDIAMASAVGGGFASATSASKIAAYGKQLSRIGETSEQSIESLALIKQELETVINNYDKNPFASKEQKEGMKKELEKLNKAIPFNMDQINAVRKAKSSGKSFGEATVKGQPSKIMQDADAILGIK